MSQIWEINGLSLELDMEEYDTVLKYRKAFEKMSEEKKKIQKDGDLSVFIKNYCLLYYHLFDNLFGEGISKKNLVKNTIVVCATKYMQIFLIL